MKQHYLTLDALRGVAAIAVVARHLDGISAGNPFPASYLAVDFFFALSGFVLAHAYGKRLGAGLSLKQFMTARLIRLYPLYFASGMLALATVALKIAVGESGPVDLLVRVANLFFIPLPLGENIWHIYPLNFPAWSLGLELIINVVFGLIVFHLKPWRLATLLAISGLALAGAAFHYGTLDTGVHWSDAWGGVPRVSFSFFMGVAVYRLHCWKPLELPPITIVPITLALLASFLPSVSLQGVYDLLAIFLIFPVLLLAGAAVSPPTLVRGLCEFLGATSYAVYILHVPIRDVVLALLHYLPLPPSWWLGGGFIIIAIATAWAADELYDRPVRQRLVGKLRFSQSRA